jgi:hypothetical protein
VRHELTRARLRRWKDVAVFDVATELTRERRTNRRIRE